AMPDIDADTPTDDGKPVPTVDTADTRPVEAKLPPVQNIPIGELEHYGLLTTPADRSLGIDMWIGSHRGEIAAMLPQIPAESRYRTLQDLTARMLLTETDSEMIDGPRSPAGEDLMTLRLEKLIEMGSYDQAARLYAVNPGRPYHERLARAGVTAMLYSGRKALGCLEVKALADGYKDEAFWQQIAVICDVFLSNDLAKNKQITVPTGVFANTPLLEKLVDKSGYRFRPDNMDELAQLNTVERLALFALQRVDYSKISRLNLADIMKTDPTLLAAMLADQTLPARLRLYTLLAAVSVGTADIAQLTAFYESDNAVDDAKGDKGWKSLPALYRQAKSYSPGNARDSVLQQALALRRAFGTAALLPFAPLIAESDPGNLTPESIAASLAVMVKAGQEIPDKWRNLGLAALSPQHRANDDALTFFAYDISQGFTPLKTLESTEFAEFLQKMDPATAKIVKTIYEKLDKDSKLHNIVADGPYEKEPALTVPDDYVMPLSDLLSNLALAEKDKRLGEVILISSILLRATSPGRITPEVLGEVLDGYKTVGLTREARDLAAEVVLGLRK
ncbi:MAG: hypothetical protein KKA05_02540, partial [Alphaproteobacteria bacterium]|nr:hypothetical protein [Alphaproteobacteria bacterium]